MIDKNAPVGVFDSGVGGLTVAREIMRNLPSEKIVYFGDTARVPYGSKSKDTVIRYSSQIVHFLREQNVKAIVIACNTASAFALEAVQDKLDIPVLGVIEAGARVAAEETKNKRVGVIGTVGTVGSGIHESYLKRLNPEITVIGKACPLFVPLVEEGWLHDPVTVEVASRYLQELKDEQVDTLILGCTHYPLIRSTIQEVMGEKVRLVNPAYETALELKSLLTKMDLLSTGEQQAEFPYRFYVSDLADEFKEFANSILPYDVTVTRKVESVWYSATSMKKVVRFRVRGGRLMDTEDEQEPLEIVVPGQYYYRNGSHYLRYEEMMDDTAQPTVNYIKLSPQGVEVRKQGQVNVHMVFEQGKKNMTLYSTPFGTLQMGIAATGLEIMEDEDCIQMKVDYALDMNDEHVADCYLTVQAQSKDLGDFSFYEN